MDTRNVDIKISMPNTPVGLSEWTNEAVNQVILESNTIHTIINNLDADDEITVMDTKKNEQLNPIYPFLVVQLEGFALYFSHMNYIVRVDLHTSNNPSLPDQPIYQMAFHCKFGEPLKITDTHELGLNAGLTGKVTFIELMPEKVRHITNKIRNILTETIENSECNITEINM